MKVKKLQRNHKHLYSLISSDNEDGVFKAIAKTIPYEKMFTQRIDADVVDKLKAKADILGIKIVEILREYKIVDGKSNMNNTRLRTIYDRIFKDLMATNYEADCILEWLNDDSLLVERQKTIDYHNDLRASFAKLAMNQYKVAEIIGISQGVMNKNINRKNEPLPPKILRFIEDILK